MAKRSLRRFPNLVSGPAWLRQCLGAVEVEARENPSWLAAMTTIAHAALGSRIYVSSCDLGPALPNPLQSGGVHIRQDMTTPSRQEAWRGASCACPLPCA